MKNWSQKVSKKLLLTATVLFLIFILNALPGMAQTAGIPIPDPKNPLKDVPIPANDLTYNGQPIDTDEAAALILKGVDISLLDPISNDVWVSHSLPAVEPNALFPPDGATVDFVQEFPPLEDQARAVVDYEGETYHATFSFQGHTALVMNALLRKLGYPISSPRHFKTITIQFASKSQKDAFLLSAKDKLVVDEIDHENWVISQTDTKLVLRDMILQQGRVEVPPYHWGAIERPDIQGRRTMRALIIPFTLADILQSINVMGWEVGKIIDRNVSLNQPYADQFVDTTYDDARWILRRIAKLTRADWTEIVRVGQYPYDVSALVVEKLISRRNQMMELFGLEKEVAKIPYTTNVNIGTVKNGKLTKIQYEGYATRFSYGDPDSPLTKSEIFRFFKIEAIAVAMTKLLDQVDKYLTVQSIDDVGRKHADEVSQSILNHIRKNGPFVPYSQPVKFWGGPVGGASVNASRNVISGTYYGVDSKVQLVDNIGVQANAGYFYGVQGLKKVGIGGLANVSINRNYLHIRPVNSIKEADKESWKHLIIPRFMKHLGKMIDPSLPIAKAQKPYRDFFEEMNDGEQFVIIDSIAGGVGASIAVPIMNLLSLPIGGTATAVASTNQNLILLKRTTFVRTKDGFQVYVQSVKSSALSQSFDFNWWINIWKWTGIVKSAEAKSQVYTIPWDYALPTEEDGGDIEKLTEVKQAKLRTAASAVRALLVKNDSTLLRKNYAPYELDHELWAKIRRQKLLWKRWDRTSETHVARVRPPLEKDENGNPKFDPKDHERTLASYQIIKRKGNDYYSMISDIIDGFAQGYGPGSASGGNPAYSFFGNGNWTAIRTEAEITKGRDFLPVTAIENYWAGWSISKKHFFKILDLLESKIKALNMQKPVIRRDEFNNMQKLQLFEIRSTLVLYKDGMQKLVDKLTARGGERKLFQELGRLGGREYQRYCEVMLRQYGANGQQKYYGESGEFDCALPWMKTVLDLRRVAPKNDRIKEMQWTTKLIETLHENLDLPVWINWLGQEHFFYVIRINGYRTKDENGDKSYISDMVGNFDPELGSGIFEEFVSKYKIISYEMNARYLNEGF